MSTTKHLFCEQRHVSVGACRKMYLSVFSVAVKTLFSLLPKYNNSYNRYFKGSRLTFTNFSAVGSTTIDEKQDSELVW